MKNFVDGVLAHGIFLGALSILMLFSLYQTSLFDDEALISALMGAVVGGAFTFSASFWINAKEKNEEAHSAVLIAQKKLFGYAATFALIEKKLEAVKKFRIDENEANFGTIDLEIAFEPFDARDVASVLPILEGEQKEKFLNYLAVSELIVRKFERLCSAQIEVAKTASLPESSILLKGNFTIENPQSIAQDLENMSAFARDLQMEVLGKAGDGDSDERMSKQAGVHIYNLTKNFERKTGMKTGYLNISG
ncbi:hypothetical protein [Donghicola tyrosinivorans]|uniref:Uncharacterized protein n=1 Tax=Donghicola tyrosinivorans TaxID=1652492 RepID=A0A2T0WM55_9RHOB|nr:hypothetical protein [Donghicola tyrosinivorans]PRY87765.1 hypothetical protein CLV74_10986 [Donghicola tyrosinivorans]